MTQRWVVSVLVGLALANLDQTMVCMALPTIVGRMGESSCGTIPNPLAWKVSVFLQGKLGSCGYGFVFGAVATSPAVGSVLSGPVATDTRSGCAGTGRFGYSPGFDGSRVACEPVVFRCEVSAGPLDGPSSGHQEEGVGLPGRLSNEEPGGFLVAAPLRDGGR